jgi:thiol-disulfide isomerase/thioredoxin
MKRPFKIATTIAMLAVAQVGAWLVYGEIEERRSEPHSKAFDYEALSDELPAYDESFELPDGGHARVSDYRKRPLLLHFWATWCSPCRTELPTLIGLAEEQTNDLDVLLVSVDEAWPTVRHYFDGKVPNGVVRDSSGAAKARFRIATLPETIIIDADGRPVARVRGARQWTSTHARSALTAIFARERAR